MHSSPDFRLGRTAERGNAIRRLLGIWWFSLVLGVVYVAVFNLWRSVQAQAVLTSALIASGLLCMGLGLASAKKYFHSFWEALLHFLIILDIFLEGVLIPEHASHSFYWCALAFAILIVGYRLHLRHRMPARTANP